MSGLVVVDASVAIRWLVREEHSDKALAILRAWHEDEVTPTALHLLPFKVATALHRRVLRGQLRVTDAARMTSRLISSQLELLQTAGLHARALELASELQQGRSTTPTIWRWLRSSTANSGQPTGDSTRLRAQRLATRVG